MKPVSSNTISGISTLLLCMLTLLLFACDTTSETSNNDLDTCSVNFKVAVNDSSDNNTVSRALDEILNCNEIYDVEADIFGPDDALLQQGGPWDCEVGQGTVTDVPAGTDGTLAVLCNNEAGEVVYRGVSVITLIPGATVDAGTIVTDEFMPSQLSPADNATDEINGNVYFEWAAVSGAVEYDIQVISPSTVEYTTSDTNYRAHDLTAPSTIYTWRIRAVDSQGNQGAWSNPLSFTTDSNEIPSVSITSPSGYVFGNVIFDQTSSDDGNIASYVWTLVETEEVIGTTDNFTKNDLALGDHTVELVVTDNVGAIATDTSTFTYTNIEGTWSLSATNEQSGSCQVFGDKVNNGTITYLGDNTFRLQLGTLWDKECDPSSSPCLFYGSPSGLAYTFTNSWTDSASGYDYSSTITVTAQGNDSYTGTLTTTESISVSPDCTWTYDITLTRQ